MLEYARKVYGQIAEFMNQLSGPRKVAMAFVSVAIVAGIASMVFWAGDKTFQPLMSNLNPEDAANVIRVLREKHIPFRVDTSGRNITVPPENLYELRFELASTGLPQSGVVGYEVFDKTSLGTTSFVQQVNEKRAREGELIRTINTIKGVRRSRVHLALPKKSAFVEDQKKPTASVVVDLEPGQTLNEKQIYGIGNLVARAVDGMEVADVVIVDSNGKTLSKNPSDTLSAQNATQMEFRQKYENDLEKKIEEMLGRVVGEGHVVARVNAEVDFSQTQETQTTYDADGSAVRSVQRDVKTMEGTRPGPYGLAGARSNTPGETPAANQQIRNDTKTNAEVTNYEVPQTVRRVVKPSWSVQKLSVAVAIDGKTVKETGKDGAVLSKVQPWAPEKLQEFEQLVSSAAGLDRKRGDTLEIKSMDFAHEDFEEAQRLLAESERKSYIMNMVMYGIIGLTIVLFFLMVVRPFIKWITENTIDSVDSFLPQTIEELERLQKNSQLPGMEDSVPVIPERVDPDKVEGEMIKEKIITLVDANPHKAALILKDWLHGEANKKKPAGDGKEPGKGKSA